MIPITKYVHRFWTAVPVYRSYSFKNRHIGPNYSEVQSMLKTINCLSLNEMVDKTVPQNIRRAKPMNIGEGLSEYQALNSLKDIAKQNSTLKSYIGMGYYGTFLPPPIQRNVLENPAWYTPYAPYQAEISQGRLEGLLVYQTMIQDLTGMDISNASLLDEATAATEAMNLAHSVHKKKRDLFFVSDKCHPQTIATLRTRAKPLGIKIFSGDVNNNQLDDSYFGTLIQYPNTDGTLESIDKLKQITDSAKKNDIVTICATDLMALTLIKPPGEIGFDIAVGSSQRFGVPMGFGGPAAAFFATYDKFKRLIPGRIVGISKDVHGNRAIRLALQSREQHIKRENATSNICTSQNLLANISGFYAMYHGAEGLKNIGKSIHQKALILHRSLSILGYTLDEKPFFDTIKIDFMNRSQTTNIYRYLRNSGIHVRNSDYFITLSIDELTTYEDIKNVLEKFASYEKIDFSSEIVNRLIDNNVEYNEKILIEHKRESKFLENKIFNTHNTETKLMRYLHTLQSKDISLVNSMMPLGSCTMKLNSASEMMPVTWSEFSSIHPFVPLTDTEGYLQIIKDLEMYLANITGFDATSLQPNAGSQGEYTGLYMIKEYHRSNNQNRNVCLVPVSSHGTNPASARLCGMKVVTVNVNTKTGCIDTIDLKSKCEEHSDDLAAIMITYPSVFGFFDDNIKEICDVIHSYGGQVYLDGANMNAQIGLTSPGDIGADVCHLNLHKTFCIPHGGGGPGMGPICVKSHLMPYLPTHPISDIPGTSKETSIGTIAAAPWSSANILPIVWMYIKMMGDEGLTEATKIAILNANYMMTQLESHYKIKYRGSQGFTAHEFIIDLSEFIEYGITEEDIAKRLIDYGFHAPTMSWPVRNSLMIEPTESESKDEIDRYIASLISIRGEIKEIEDRKVDVKDSVLKNAPHTVEICTNDKWNKKYSREQAAYPLEYIKENKFWPPVGRVDNVYGDRNLFCSCGE